eukprot:SM000090S24284  [mRNA]  locus=s90:57683:59656:- [translate_table: standard]
MKVRRQKHNRRAVRFLRTCFGFREPFKVLCDGNFLHAALQGRPAGLADALPKLLGGAAKPMVTRCVSLELRRLGAAFATTTQGARRMDLAKCGHDPAVAAADCLADMVGASNSEHFFVASQDSDLRRKLRKASPDAWRQCRQWQVPAAALVFSKGLMLVLEPPTPLQQAAARSGEAKRTRVPDRELAALGMAISGKQLANVHHSSAKEARASGDGDEDEGRVPSDAGDAQPAGARSGVTASMVTGDRSRSSFQRRKAKGPNPLSVRKKQQQPSKSKVQVQPPLQQEPPLQKLSRNAGDDGATMLQERKRKRKRARHRHSVGVAPSSPVA